MIGDEPNYFVSASKGPAEFIDLFRRARRVGRAQRSSPAVNNWGGGSQTPTGSRIEASYRDEDILEGLRSATASVLLIGYLLAKLTQKDAEAWGIERAFELIP